MRQKVGLSLLGLHCYHAAKCLSFVRWPFTCPSVSKPLQRLETTDITNKINFMITECCAKITNLVLNTSETAFLGTAIVHKYLKACLVLAED